jgi:hypothetical protein
LALLGILSLGAGAACGIAERHSSAASSSAAVTVESSRPGNAFTATPTIEAYVPFPSDSFAGGTDGDRIRRALLSEFGTAKVLEEPPATVVSVRNSRAHELASAQLGYPEVGDEACIQWTQGMWKMAVRSAEHDPQAVVGAVLLVNASDGAFGKPIMSEAIVTTAAAAAVDRSVPEQCRRTSVSDASGERTIQIEDVRPSRTVGESSWAYRIRSLQADTPDLWALDFQLRGHIVEVKLIVRPKTDDLAAQQRMLEDLAGTAFAKAQSVL